MALAIKDRVKEVTTTTGTGPLTLVSAPTGFRRFNSVFTDGDTTYYCIESGTQWEIGIGTYSANTLDRTTVLVSSNANALINITATRSFVFISYIADKSVYKDILGRIVAGAAGIVFSDNTVQTTAPDFSTFVLLPNVLPDVGALFSYGGDGKLQSGGAATHAGSLTLGGNLTLAGNPTLTLHAATKGYVDSAVGAVDLSGRVPYMGATQAVNLGSQNLSAGAITASTFNGIDDNVYVRNSSGQTAVRFRRTGTTWYLYNGGNNLNLYGDVGGNNLWIEGNTIRNVGNVEVTGSLTASGVATVNALAISTSNPTGGSAVSDGLEMQTATQMYFKQGGYTVFKIFGGVPRVNLGKLTIGGSGIETHLYGTLNKLEQRNSTNPQTFCISNTYTSSTSFENALHQWASNEYRTGVSIGSGGGTMRSMSLGSWNSAGTWRPALTITGSNSTEDTTLPNIAIGKQNLISGALSINAIGGGSLSTGDTNSGSAGVFFFGTTATTSPTSVAHRFAVDPVNNVVHVGGYRRAVAVDGLLTASYATGTDAAGSGLCIAGGRGTGTGAGGSIKFQTAPAGTTGSSLNALVDRLVIESNGNAVFSNQIRLPDAAFLTCGSTFGNISLGNLSGTGMQVWHNNVNIYGSLQWQPTQSSLNPTTSDIPSGRRVSWYNSTLGEFRDWVNIGGTLYKSAPYTT